MKTPLCWLAAVVGGALLATGTASARVTPEALCQAKKNIEAGKYSICLERAEAQLVRTKGTCSESTATSCYLDGDCPTAQTCVKNTDKYAARILKCRERFTARWAQWERNAEDKGARCPSLGDEWVLEGLLMTQCERVAMSLQVNRFEDNGDGTVTDHVTGLMWERKTGTFTGSENAVDCSVTPCDDPHDVYNLYQWSATGSSADGGVFLDFLDKLNGASPTDGCFAGYCDWRMPTKVELETILLGPYPCDDGLCISDIFGPTAPYGYWSFTTSTMNHANAWCVYFDYGSPDDDGKVSKRYARAVRCGM